MENKRPSFDETVSVLVKAYMNDTLVQGHPCGCGCGNIIAAANNIKVIYIDEESACWDNDKIGSGFDWYRALYPYKSTFKKGNADNGLTQIQSTGYSVEQFYKIEKAFEDVNKLADGSYKSPTQESIFDGLMSVLEILADIHGVDLTTKEEAKKLFVKS